MLVLLPPSEGKADAAEGTPVDLDSLTLSEQLTRQRRLTLDTLVALCRDEPEYAQHVLGLGDGLKGEVARNAALAEAPAVPAADLYTGVLYENLALDTLPRASRTLAERDVLVFSGLWGAVRLSDRIPRYRCPMGVTLPNVGRLATAWRPVLDKAVAGAAGSGLVLDLRSSAYGAAWKPKRELAERTAAVRVLHERTLDDGTVKRSVVSHFNKATKGRLLRALLEAGADPKRPEDLVAALRELGYTVEPSEPGLTSGKPWRLDVVVTEV